MRDARVMHRIAAPANANDEGDEMHERLEEEEERVEARSSSILNKFQREADNRTSSSGHTRRYSLLA